MAQSAAEPQPPIFRKVIYLAVKYPVGFELQSSHRKTGAVYIASRTSSLFCSRRRDPPGNGVEHGGFGSRYSVSEGRYVPLNRELPIGQMLWSCSLPAGSSKELGIMNFFPGFGELSNQTHHCKLQPSPQCASPVSRKRF